MHENHITIWIVFVFFHLAYTEYRIQKFNVSVVYSLLKNCITPTCVKVSTIWPKLSLADERKLIRLFRNNFETNIAQFYLRIETAGVPVFTLIVNAVLHHQELKGNEPRPKTLRHSSMSSATHIDKPNAFWRTIKWFDKQSSLPSVKISTFGGIQVILSQLLRVLVVASCRQSTTM